MSWQGGPPPLPLLREIRLLSALTDAELTRLLEFGTLVRREAHANIIIEGELSWGVYLLLSGAVGVYKTNKLTGMSYDIGQIRDPGFFGEMSLVDENPRSATVKALTDCVLFHIGRDSFLKFANSSQSLRNRFYEACVRVLIERLRELDDSYVVSQYQLWKIALRKDAA